MGLKELSHNETMAFVGLLAAASAAAGAVAVHLTATRSPSSRAPRRAAVLAAPRPAPPSSRRPRPAPRASRRGARAPPRPRPVRRLVVGLSAARSSRTRATSSKCELRSRAASRAGGRSGMRRSPPPRPLLSRVSRGGARARHRRRRSATAPRAPTHAPRFSSRPPRRRRSPRARGALAPPASSSARTRSSCAAGRSARSRRPRGARVPPQLRGRRARRRSRAGVLTRARAGRAPRRGRALRARVWARSRTDHRAVVAEGACFPARAASKSSTRSRRTAAASRARGPDRGCRSRSWSD